MGEYGLLEIMERMRAGHRERAAGRLVECSTCALAPVTARSARVVDTGIYRGARVLGAAQYV